MVFYISGPLYQALINKTLSETDQACVGCEAGQDIFLKKYIKENITSFEQIDILIIDMKALADTDEEVLQSIESMRMMGYETRIIILAPDRAEGDRFLRDCFFIGVYDIINADEYLEISQQLAYCITTGMGYKDALRFRTEVVEKKTESLAVQKILIGVTGAGKRMGATHNSIVLANFLREHNQMVAIMEMNDSGIFGKICEAKKAKIFKEGYFSLQGVDFYPNSDRERVTAVTGKLYNFIILDFGSYAAADKIFFNKSDVRIIFSGTKPWELEKLEEVFHEQDEDVLQKYHFCFLGTTNRTLQKEIITAMEPLNNIWFPEYTEDPFKSTRFPEGEQILKDYLREPGKQKEKKRLFGRK